MVDPNKSSDPVPEVSESGDKLTIMNRSKIYHVSKKFICSSIPYFEKMFCCDLLEGKENTVQLDLDEHSFDCVLNWIHSDSVQIEIENVIALFDVADYLMLNDLSKDCYSYFHANFTIEHLPIVIPQVTKTSKLINSGSLNTFICRHFLKIVKTSIFLKYPVETVEYICKLDLMISSEYQVLEAINDWIKFKADDRKDCLLRLLKCIRWCYAGTDISLKIMVIPYIATIQDINEILCSPGNCKLGCASNRTNQCLLVSIQETEDLILSIRVLQSHSWLPVGNFNFDDSMSLEFVHGENVSDILYDCGTKGVRIDWEAKKFCWLNFYSDDSYYLQINKLIVCNQIASSTILYLKDNFGGCVDDPFIELFHLRLFPTSRRRHIEDGAWAHEWAEDFDFCVKSPKCHGAVKISVENDERLLLESDGKFIVVGKSKDKHFYALFQVRHLEWYKMKYYVDYDERTFIATVLGSNIFILTQKLRFIQFNYETNVYKKTAPFRDSELEFVDLIITSQQDNNKILLVHKSSGKIHYFNIDSQTWTETSIKYRKPDQIDSNDCIMTSTTVFLPLDKINHCFKPKFSSLNL
ncbi:uncharacterized protein LOC107360972 [Tetranychus urticae]|uniref:uncharacterized protein LOC107360972 n=1 Tax=Tetranychus urticae TaxID=32264 RepID=UPI00077BDAFD|nr:uncharacterized protein LOC107360972 [Tetranychus urticae]